MTDKIYFRFIKPIKKKIYNSKKDSPHYYVDGDCTLNHLYSLKDLKQNKGYKGVLLVYAASPGAMTMRGSQENTRGLLEMLTGSSSRVLPSGP